MGVGGDVGVEVDVDVAAVGGGVGRETIVLTKRCLKSSSKLSLVVLFEVELVISASFLATTCC